MRGRILFSMVGFCVAAVIFSAAAQTKTITVMGKVVDSVTGAAIPKALILLHDMDKLDFDPSNLGNLQLDSVFSDANGAFTYQMTAIQNAILLGYVVIKQGYQVHYGIAGIILNIANLGTIKLVPSSLAAKDTIAVSGKVVDSATGAAIGGALVAISGLGEIDTAGNTALTSGDGTFSKQVIIGKTALGSMVAYVVTKQGYASRIGQKQATSKQLDLGTIALSRNAGVIPSAVSFPQRRSADAMGIYSLNGRRLYKGPAVQPDRVLPLRSGLAVLRYTGGGAVIATKKAVPVK